MGTWTQDPPPASPFQPPPRQPGKLPALSAPGGEGSTARLALHSRPPPTRTPRLPPPPSPGSQVSPSRGRLPAGLLPSAAAHGGGVEGSRRQTPPALPGPRWGHCGGGSGGRPGGAGWGAGGADLWVGVLGEDVEQRRLAALAVAHHHDLAARQRALHGQAARPTPARSQPQRQRPPPQPQPQPRPPAATSSAGIARSSSRAGPPAPRSALHAAAPTDTHTDPRGR